MIDVYGNKNMNKIHWYFHLTKLSGSLVAANITWQYLTISFFDFMLIIPFIILCINLPFSICFSTYLLNQSFFSTLAMSSNPTLDIVNDDSIHFASSGISEHSFTRSQQTSLNFERKCRFRFFVSVSSLSAHPFIITFHFFPSYELYFWMATLSSFSQRSLRLRSSQQRRVDKFLQSCTTTSARLLCQFQLSRQEDWSNKGERDGESKKMRGGEAGNQSENWIRIMGQVQAPIWRLKKRRRTVRDWTRGTSILPLILSSVKSARMWAVMSGRLGAINPMLGDILIDNIVVILNFLNQTQIRFINVIF